MVKLKGALVLALVFLGSVHAGEGNRFVFAQLKHKGAWDPYPTVHQAILKIVAQMTNIPHVKRRKDVSLTEPGLFEVPFLVIKGNSPLVLSKKEKQQLKKYIDRGGFVFIDDTLAEPNGPFADSIRSLMKELYPSERFHALPQDHAIFRAFFLLRKVAGRRVSSRVLEGLEVGGQGGGESRTAVVFCPNDLFGAWVKDNLGGYAYSCEPGGETQRWESFKLTINVIYFSITGTYKKDAVHQPFIERKLRS